MAYAEQTKVPVERTKAEIEALMRRYGATAFGTAQEADRGLVFFRLKERMIRFELPLAVKGEQAMRTKWRALLLVIKAKLEAVASGIVTMEDEFLAQTVMSDGETVGKKIQAQVDENYRVGGPPKLMLTGASQ